MRPYLLILPKQFHPTGDQVFKQISLWRPFSFRPLSIAVAICSLVTYGFKRLYTTPHRYWWGRIWMVSMKVPTHQGEGWKSQQSSGLSGSVMPKKWHNEDHCCGWDAVCMLFKGPIWLNAGSPGRYHVRKRGLSGEFFLCSSFGSSCERVVIYGASLTWSTPSSLLLADTWLPAPTPTPATTICPSPGIPCQN